MTQPVNGARTGPMPTAGRWGWYRDHEGSEYRRASTLVKEVETDNYNLEKWKLRQVAEGFAIRDDLVLSVKAMGRPEDPLVGWSQDEKRKLDGITSDAMQAAKQRDGARSGTAYHDLTERIDRGEPIDSAVRGLPAPVAIALRAYAFLRRENGWVNIETERTVVCDDLEVAGTFDRVDLIPGLAALLGPGTCQHGHPEGQHNADIPGLAGELPVIVDVKTEKDPTLNGLHIGPQLAIYSRAKRMWRAIGGVVPLLDASGNPKTYERSGDPILIPAGEYVPAPCVRQDVGVVVHVYDGDAVPYFLNLTEGWDAAQAAYAQAERKARAKRKLGTPGAWFALVPGIKRPPAAAMLVEQTAAANPAGGAQVAVRGADGLVRWEPAPVEPPIGTQTEVAGVGFTKVDTMENVAERGPLDAVDRQAIESIWSAADTDGLRRIWDIYTKTVGRSWGGRVAEAGEARRRQVECVQRALHTMGTTKCACGWTPGIPA
jgi:hypothetical protein